MFDAERIVMDKDKDAMIIHVRLQNRILDNKTTALAFLPILIWVAVVLGTLFTMLATSYYLLVPVLGVEFVCIIPLFLVCQKRVRKAFEALDDIYYEADLEVHDRKLYYEGKPLKIKYNKKSGIVSLQREVVGGKYKAKVLVFWSIVHEEDTETFFELCKFYHVDFRG